MPGNIFTADFKAQPCWITNTAEDAPTQQLPRTADVVIVGSGYTGLSAALVTARSGRHTVVIDAGSAGQGCSVRNGGQVSSDFKPDITELTARFGPDLGRRINDEGVESICSFTRFLDEEGIDCDWQPNGRFIGAHSARACRQLAGYVETLGPENGMPAPWMIPADKTRSEIDSPFYHGGAVLPSHGAIHPWKLHRALLQRCRTAGAGVITDSAALRTEKTPHGFSVHTGRGVITAGAVLIACNGYRDNLLPWLRRRTIPIGSQQILTEELGEDRVKQLLPNNRVISDTRRVVVYYRSSPDGRRIIFGGRATATDRGHEVYAPKLHRMLVQIFPQLRDTRITRAWHGTVAFTFDELPHIGQHNGMYYCTGYCGSGIAFSLYYGRKAGQKIIGDAQGATALDNLEFPMRPYFNGNPWFLPAAIIAYRIRDRLS